MITLFFELWSLPFLILLGFETLSMAALLNFEEEHRWYQRQGKPDAPLFGPIIISLLLFFGLWFLFGDAVSVFSQIDPLMALLWAGTYFLAGGIFSIFRWTVHVSRFVNFVKKSDKEQKFFLPRVNNNKDMITSWIGFWPFHLVGYLLESPFTKVCSAVLSLFRGLYDRIARRMTADIADKLINNEKD